MATETAPAPEGPEARTGFRVKQSTIIDTHKGLTPVFVLALMAIYDEWQNPVLWAYFGLHGSYGVLWATKGRFFPDKQWQKQIGLGEAVFSVAGLTGYWVAGWLIATHNSGEIEPWFMGCCIFLYAIGVFLHFAADMQKHMSLQLRPGVLITEGMWGIVRNPNYLGELCIYLGFCLLALHWAPLVLLGAIIAFAWIPNMRRKDASLSRYPEFAEYKARTKMFIPYVW